MWLANFIILLGILMILEKLRSNLESWEKVKERH